MPDNIGTPPTQNVVGGEGLIFKHHYDREDEVETKESVMRLLKSLQEWAARNTHPEMGDDNGKPYILPIRDTVAIGEIRMAFSKSRYLLLKYKEVMSADKVKTYIDFLTEQRELDTLSTIQNLEMLSDMLATKLGVKHGFKDRTDDAQPWDKIVKKKLEFPELTKEEEEYRAKLFPEWNQFAFDVTFYVVRCKGDAHILLSGPNLSGKSSTAIPFLIRTNYHLRTFWDVDKYNEYFIQEHPDSKGAKTSKFSIKRDIYVTPDSQDLRDRFKVGQYQSIDVNEGMEAATNIQSQKNEAVQLGIKRFTTRSYHNIIVWEYQVQQRPTAMMLEGMNFWMQKMRKRHFILSIASTLVRKKDPYYMKELDKCRTDKEIGNWMTKENPNFIHTFRAPRMGPRLEHAFQMWYWESKERQSHSEKVKRSIGQDYGLMIEDMWKKVNEKHTFTFIEIGDELGKIGFNDADKKSFMRDYGKYSRLKMWEGHKKEEEQTEVMTNGA